MNATIVLTFTLIVIVCCGFPAVAQDRTAEVAAFSKAGRQFAGVSIALTKQVRDESGQDGLCSVNWKISYQGARAPFVILRPSLSGILSGQTRIVAFAFDPDSEIHIIGFSRPDLSDSSTLAAFRPKIGERRLLQLNLPGAAMAFEDYDRRWFLESRDPDAGGDTFAIKVNDIAVQFRARFPKYFAAAPEEIYIQLEHAPSHRGDILEHSSGILLRTSADAWTGIVQSNVLRISTPKDK